MGTGTLAAAVLGGVACGISPPGGGCHYPTTEPQGGQSQIREQLYQRSSGTTAKVLGANLEIQQRDLTKSPVNLTLKVSRI